MEHGVPTYAYDYETAVEKNHVLVPYYNIEVTTKILNKGITYDDLPEEEKERYEEDFTDEDGEIPDFIPPADVNKFIFNQHTVDMVLEDLMTKGIKVAGGDRIGKTIIFAQNKNHAQYIVERFDKLYPQYKGGFIKRVVAMDSVKIGRSFFGVNNVINFKDLGFYGIFKDICNTKRFNTINNDVLDKLKKYDEEANLDLYLTLKSLLWNNMSTEETAKELYLHKNTINYRKKKIVEILEYEPWGMPHLLNTLICIVSEYFD